MHIHSKTTRVGFAIVVGLALVLGSVISTSALATTRAANQELPTLRLDYFAGAKGQLAQTLDPAQVTSATAADTIAMVNANLVDIGTDNKVHLDLAQRYTVSKDRKTYTFWIRPNARYSNGHYVTASHFKYAIERALAKSTASPVACTYLCGIVGARAYNEGKAGHVSGVKVLGTRVLRITLEKPYAYFLKTLTYPTADALDPAVMRGKTASQVNNFLTKNCPGNQGAGPFTFQCTGTGFHQTGRTPSYTLVPNPYYYGRKPHLKVVLPAIDTADTAYKSYLAGQLDTTPIPSGFVQQWRGKKELLTFPTSIVAYMTPNMHVAPMSNVHCRLAVAYGIDRNTLINKILNGLPRAIYTVVPPGFLGYYNGKDNPHYNLKKAKAEFNQCAVRNTPLTYTYATGSSDADNAGAYIVSSLKQIGFNATGKALSVNDWYNVVSQPLDRTKTQLVRNGWQQDYPDPQDYVSLLLRSGQDYNIGGFSHRTFDRMVDRADLEGNATQRAKLYRQAQHIAVGKAVAWVPLWNSVGYRLVKPYVHGLTGTVAYGDLVPRNHDWANVSVDKH